MWTTTQLSDLIMSFAKLDLTGRAAVVIGGTSGIGRAIAHGLAEAGGGRSLHIASERTS